MALAPCRARPAIRDSNLRAAVGDQINDDRDSLNCDSATKHAE